jgi:hypothetical protein
MTWVHVPADDATTGESNLLQYSGVASMRSAIADQCVPGIWAEGGNQFIRLNDDIAYWLACRVDGYRLYNEQTKKDDFHHTGEGVDVWIDDPKVAMLFKLTYGGPKTSTR